MNKEHWYQHPYNLVDLFEDTVAKHADRNWIGTKMPTGEYRWMTYREGAARVDNLRGGLARLGISKDDAVGLIINNALEWPIIAFACFGLGARIVPMYEHELEKMWRFIAEDSRIKILFVKDETIFNQVKGYANEIATLDKIVSIRDDSALSMNAIEAMGKASPIPSIKPHWSDIASLIYTSGTSGKPKGVLLNHGNFTSNVSASIEQFPVLGPDEVAFSILPWAHSFGQTSELYLMTSLGASMGLMSSVDAIGDELVLVRPTVLIGVPRVFNRIYTGIHTRIESDGGVRQKLFELAKKEARRAREKGRKTLLLWILDKIVFRKIRDKFGGRLRYACTGSAVMNPEIARFFFDIGIPVYEGYGLTETTPVITSNRPDATKIGSVGRPIKNVTVVIDKSQVGEESPDGEILCFGPNVMVGYYNEPNKTNEVIVEDAKLGRGVRTGDRGRLDSDGFLYITGRFKEEYKLENGKYVHPSSVEEDIKLLPWVANAMIYGDGRKYNVCLVVPNFSQLSDYAKKIGLTHTDPQSLVEEEKIRTFISREIQNHLKRQYGEYEIPKKFEFLTEDFTVDNGMLTQTMKLKRGEVLKKYKDALIKMYD
jgi:long-chain acyl-CoA synthetase